MKSRQKNEQSLINKAISGDKEAFGHLYDRYYQKIFKYLLFRLGIWEDAEDLAEVVFLKAWEHLPGFGKKQKGNFFQAWLFKIAHNTLVDRYRTKRFVTPIDNVPEELSFGQNPAEVAFTNEKEKIIRDAILSLEKIAQDVIISRFINGLSHKETALLIGIKEGNVRIIQYRALKKIRKILGEKDV